MPASSAAILAPAPEVPMIPTVRGSHTLGDFLNDTFSLVPLIWKRALPVSLLSIVPGATLWTLAMRSLGSWIRTVAGEGSSIGRDPSRALSGIGPALVFGILASILLFVGQAYQKAFVCAQSGAALEGRSTSFAKLALAALRPAWLRVAVQEAVIDILAGYLVFAVIGAILFPFIAAKLGDFVGQRKEVFSQTAFFLQLLALYFASIIIALAANWWLKVKTCVSAPATVLEDRNSFAGMGRSLALVRGRGWRVFGAMFIVSLVISFGLGILTGPITFGVAMPGYFVFLRDSIGGKTPSAESLLSLFSSLSWAIGVSLLISGTIKGTLWPAFLTLLHADLRARSGEPRGAGSRRTRLSGARRLRALGALSPVREDR
jgi:hypothetical protein